MATISSPPDKMRDELVHDETVREELPDVASHLLEECRMVLPGIQALFGFQLIAVFNQRFDSSLSHAEQVLHLAAICLVALAVALVMTPAAYHRQREPENVSRHFVKIASALLLSSMLPLAIGICLDFYLIARLILHDIVWSIALSGVLFVFFFVLWFLLPRLGQPRKSTIVIGS